jgi:large subunit ribosomal protein L7/L12
MDEEDKKEAHEEDKKGPAEAAEKAEKATEAAQETKEAAGEANEAAEEAVEATEEAKATVDSIKGEVKEEAKEAVAEAKDNPLAGGKAPEPKEEPKKEIKVTGKLADIIKEIEGLTVVELSDLVRALENRFGVTAAPTTVGVAAGGVPAGAEGEAEEGQTTFNVVLADSGANKIGVIKAVRELVPTLGLKEAKDLVDSAPKPVLQGVNKETSNEAKTKLEAAGAKVKLQ